MQVSPILVSETTHMLKIKHMHKYLLDWSLHLEEVQCNWGRTSWLTSWHPLKYSEIGGRSCQIDDCQPWCQCYIVTWHLLILWGWNATRRGQWGQQTKWDMEEFMPEAEPYPGNLLCECMHACTYNWQCWVTAQYWCSAHPSFSQDGTLYWCKNWTKKGFLGAEGVLFFEIHSAVLEYFKPDVCQMYVLFTLIPLEASGRPTICSWQDISPSIRAQDGPSQAHPV